MRKILIFLLFIVLFITGSHFYNSIQPVEAAEPIVVEILELDSKSKIQEETIGVKENVEYIKIILEGEEFLIKKGTTWNEWKKEIEPDYYFVTGIDWTVWRLTETYIYVVTYRDRPVYMGDELIDEAVYEFGLIDPDRYS